MTFGFALGWSDSRHGTLGHPYIADVKIVKNTFISQKSGQTVAFIITNLSLTPCS